MSHFQSPLTFFETIIPFESPNALAEAGFSSSTKSQTQARTVDLFISRPSPSSTRTLAAYQPGALSGSLIAVR